MVRRLLTLCLILAAVIAVPVYAQDATYEGRLDSSTSTQSFDLTLEAGQAVTITTEADELDTVLRLYDAEGDLLAENDDRGDGSLNSQIVFAASESGTYQIEVSRYSDAVDGDFTLTIVEGTDFGLSSTAQTIFEGSGELTNRVESEKYTFDFNAGDILVVTTLAMNSELDTTLELLDSGGTILAQNDDREAGNLNSQLIYEISASGSYTIVVSSYNRQTTGVYLLSVATDPNATPPFNYSTIEGTPLAEYSGLIDNEQDTEEYEVSLSAGQTVLALVDATSGDLDTVLTLLDPQGFTVALNDDRNDGTLNSAIAYTAATEGTYTLRVGRYQGGSSTGNYNLTLSLVDSGVVAIVNSVLADVITLSGQEQILDTENFRIHYTLEGEDAVTEAYLQDFAETLETIFNIQINEMGWAAPPRHDDGRYHAYIADVIGRESGTLGYAKPVMLVADNPNTDTREETAARAALVVDNDYAGESDNPQSLMRATTTHEFNHIIQYGYDSQEPLSWLFEATATWIETATVGDEQAATMYVSSNFSYPELCFATEEQGGQLAYGDWTFIQTLADQFGERAVVRLWENTLEYDGLEVVEQTLSEYDSSLAELVALWRVQTFARDYDLAPLFGATVWLEQTIDDAGEWTFTGEGIQELGANYFHLDMDGTFDVKLDGPETLELWLLGVDGNGVHAVPLGSQNAISTEGYDYAALMVFNTETPSDLAGCSYEDYQIGIEPGEGMMPTPSFSFSAEYFEPLSMPQ